MNFHEPFVRDTDFFTEFGNDDANATMFWQGGRLIMRKLVKGWGLAGIAQTNSFILSALTQIELDVTLTTNTVGDSHSSDNNSLTLMNLFVSAPDNPQPVVPALSEITFGFTVGGGKAAIQNGQGGGQYFTPLQAGGRYRIVHSIESNGHLAVYCFGPGQPGFLGKIEADFRGDHCRFLIEPYFTDTLKFNDFKITGV